MKIPARYVSGNCVFTFSGDTWAVFAIDPPTYARLAAKDKLAWHARVTAALGSLGTETMILGVSRAIAPAEVAAAMVAGVDIAAHPRWAAESLDALNAMERGVDGRPPPRRYERAHYLVVALPSPPRGRAAAQVGAAAARIGARFGLAPLPVPAREVTGARRAAADVERPLAGFLGADVVRAATADEIRWLYARAASRGCVEPTPAAVSGTGARLRAVSLVALGNHVLVEGGDESDQDRPRHRRYVRVETEAGVSYQTFAVVADMPRSYAYPDGKGELLHRLGDIGFPLDWCVRVRPTANADAQSKITGQVRQLSGQYHEYDGDLAGAPDSLAEAVETNRDELGELARNPSLPELQVTIVVAIGAPTLVDLEERAGRVRAVLEANEYGLPRPTGDQRALWGTIMPGAPLAPVCNDYTQFMLPKDLAGLAPFAGASLGDGRGALLGYNLDAGDAPVLFSASYGPSMPRERGGPLSGSIGIFGKVRGGKSQTAKGILTATVDTGGQVIVTDRTAMGEYVRLAPLMAGRSQVVTIGVDSGVCLDPLRVFTGEPAIRYSIGFLTLLTGTEPTSLGGAELAEAVRAVAAAGGGLVDVGPELARSGDEEARALARKLTMFTRAVGLAGVAFGTGEPVRLDADYVVFHVPELDLPSRDVLMNPVLSRQLLPEQVFSQALLYLITAVKASVAFSDRTRFSLVVVDEGYVLTASPQGEQLLLSVGKGGPKENAGLMFISHLPSEMPAGVADLLGARFLFRMDRRNAAEGLAFLGLPATADLIDTIAEDSRAAGECLLVDRFARCGLVRIAEPADEARRDAFDTGLSRVLAAPAPPANRSHRRRVA